MITFEDVKNNEEINAYIRAADKVMDAIGYTGTLLRPRHPRR